MLSCVVYPWAPNLLFRNECTEIDTRVAVPASKNKGPLLGKSWIKKIFFVNYWTNRGPRNHVCWGGLHQNFEKRIAQEYVDLKSKLRHRFSNAVDVCLTADAWGSKKRNFLGVKAHCLEATSVRLLGRKRIPWSVVRCSAALACKRFVGIFCTYFLFSLAKPLDVLMFLL